MVDEASKEQPIRTTNFVVAHYTRHKTTIDIILTVKRKITERYWANLNDEARQQHCQARRFLPTHIYTYAMLIIFCAEHLGWCEGVSCAIRLIL